VLVGKHFRYRGSFFDPYLEDYEQEEEGEGRWLVNVKASNPNARTLVVDTDELEPKELV